MAFTQNVNLSNCSDISSHLITGYNQSITGCGSQQRHCKLNLIWLRWETYTLKSVWCSTKTTVNVYVSQRSQIQFEDKDHAVYMSFHWVTTTLSSLRTTTCDALIVPSEYVQQPNRKTWSNEGGQ